MYTCTCILVPQGKCTVIIHCMVHLYVHVMYGVYVHTCYRLKYVNLDNNELYTVPQLRLIGTSPLKSPATTETRRPTPGSRRSSLTPPRHHRSTTPRGSGQGSLAGKEIVSERASDSVPNIGSSPCEQGSEAAVEPETSRTVEIDRATVVSSQPDIPCTSHSVPDFHQ